MKLKDGWLKEQMTTTMKEYNQLPNWIKISDEQGDNIQSYADI